MLKPFVRYRHATAIESVDPDLEIRWIGGIPHVVERERSRPVNRRHTVSEDALGDAIQDVAAALGRRVEHKGRNGYIGPHETLGVIAEEYDELLGAVRSDEPEAVDQELIDIAVACLFGLASLRTNERIVEIDEPLPPAEAGAGPDGVK